MPPEATIVEPEISTLNSGNAAAESSSAPEIDAKPGSDSSSGQDAKQTEADSSTARGAKQEEKKPELADVVQAALDKQAQALEEKSPDSEDGKPDVNATDAQAKDEPAQATEADASSNQDKDVPFHKHPRWQELVKREQALSQEVTTLKTRADEAAELERLTGSPEEFKALKDIVRTYASNPAASVPMLERLLGMAKERALVSSDLKQKVQDGLLDEQSAHEIEQARRERQQLAEQRQAEEARRVQHDRVAQQQAISQALNTWEQATASKDPDYSKLVEDVQDRLTVLFTQTYPKSADEAISLASRAYKEVRERNARRLPPARPIKAPLTDGSSRTARPRPKTFDEAIETALRGV